MSRVEHPSCILQQDLSQSKVKDGGSIVFILKIIQKNLERQLKSNVKRIGLSFVDLSYFLFYFTFIYPGRLVENKFSFTTATWQR